MNIEIDEFDEFENTDPLNGVITVRDLIQKLKGFDPDLPVLAAYTGRVRENEYFQIAPVISDLSEQNTSGDPEFYGSAKCVLLT